MDILEKIVAHKKKEVRERKEIKSLAGLEQEIFFDRKTFSLVQFLQDDQRTGIIAEFKRKSPSRGVINDRAAVEDVTAAYARSASAISVLTDHDFFGGTLNDLAAARRCAVPLLRKDFMIDEYQLYEAKAFGADVILLIAACLQPAEVKRMAKRAKSLGLEVLLEIHTESELDHICDDVDAVGVNNRNLKTFEVNIQTSLQLVEKIPVSKPAVAESGISDVETIVTLKKAGFKGFLVGENFMKHADPAIAFADFVHRLTSAMSLQGERREVK